MLDGKGAGAARCGEAVSWPAPITVNVTQC